MYFAFSKKFLGNGYGKNMASFKQCHWIKKMEFQMEFWVAFWSEIIKLVISGHKWTFLVR